VIRNLQTKMAKKSETTTIGKLLGFLVWLTGVIVALAVAFSMVDGGLSIRWIPIGLSIFFGWVVLITTLLGVLLAIAKQFE